MTFDDSDRSAPLRAGDADREQASDELRRHHADGRLTDDEFEERIARCYQARTLADLHRLLGDLPGGAGGRRVPAWSARAGIGRRRLADAPVALMALAVIGLVALLGALLHGPGGYGVHHHYPPIILPLVLAFVLWRFALRRGRVGGGRW